MLELKTIDGEHEVVLQFEHSLLSLSKWEEKHKKPFLATPTKTTAELISYYEEMLLTPGVHPSIIYRLEPEQLDRLSEYISEVRSASSVPDDGPSRPNFEVTTSELIYYWMVMLRIPFHPAETWHLSRLIMLISITGFKSQPEKKRSPKEFLAEWRKQQARLKEQGING